MKHISKLSFSLHQNKPAFSLLNNYLFGTSKKAHYASIIRHEETIKQWKTGKGTVQSDQITVILWNVNGMRSVIQKNELQKLFNTYTNAVDFVCLNETKIDFEKYKKLNQKVQLSFKESSEFEGYWNFCKVSAGYSGVMTYSRHLPMSIIEDIPGSDHHNKQGRVLTLQFQNFYLVNLYKPNSGEELVRLEYRMDYEDCFRNFIKTLQQKKPVIIASDMNVANEEIDLKNPKRNQGKACFTIQQRGKFKQLLNECNMVDSFRHLHPNQAKYSYWSYRNNARLNNVGWRLDYVLVDKRLRVQYADILTQQFGSDHCPVVATIKLC